MILIMSEALHSLFEDAPPISLICGDELFHTDDKVCRVFFVAKGQVDLVRYTSAGDRMVLHRATSGQVLAEASVYSERYHCHGVAAKPSCIRSISVGDFRTQLHNCPDISQEWARMLAHTLQAARTTSEIRSLRTVGQRLDAWNDANRPLPPKGQINGLADALGVSREALYRELAKRRLQRS